MNKKLEKLINRIASGTADINDAETVVSIIRTLEFYADKKNYVPRFNGFHSIISADAGDTARKEIE